MSDIDATDVEHLMKRLATIEQATATASVSLGAILKELSTIQDVLFQVSELIAFARDRIAKD